MRNRHIPRLCRNCQAPMARHQDACWRCGAQWASEEAPRTTLRLVATAAPVNLSTCPSAGSRSRRPPAPRAR